MISPRTSMSPIRKDCVSISVCVKEEDKDKEMKMKKENKEVTKMFFCAMKRQK